MATRRCTGTHPESFDKRMGTSLSLYIYIYIYIIDTSNFYIIYQIGFIRDRELEEQDATDSIEHRDKAGIAESGKQTKGDRTLTKHKQINNSKHSANVGKVQIRKSAPVSMHTDFSGAG